MSFPRGMEPDFVLEFDLDDVDLSQCTGCTLCEQVCPVGAIGGKVKEPHAIDAEKCIKCGSCYETCRFGAVVRN